jgi:ABC-type Fe3+-hydroxamate transport system substrate-binding protein
MMHRLTNEILWIGPFVLLGLMAVTLFRPWQTVSPPTTGHVIIDGKGREALIPETFPNVIAGPYIGDFLPKTHAPETILKIDGPRKRPRSDRKLDLLWRIYPQVVRNDALWDFPADTETVLAKDAGYVYLYPSGVAFFKEFGLTGVDFYPEGTGKDEVIATMTRVMNRIIGRGDRAEPLVEMYRRGYAELVAELRLEAIAEADRPRALGMVFDGWDRVYGGLEIDARLGLRDPTTGYMALGRESDAERILAMNPDLIFFYVGESRDFLRDPRWRGMDAVQSRRVYTHIFSGSPTYDLDQQPLQTRWMAELAYPDRMQPKLRDLILGHYQESYGYRLSEGELDEILASEINRDSARYTRFMQQE